MEPVWEYLRDNPDVTTTLFLLLFMIALLAMSKRPKEDE